MLSKDFSPKRQITTLEQDSISLTGNILIFPGDGAPEIKPLLAKGFKPEQIFCVDQNEGNIAYVISTFPDIPKANLFNCRLKAVLPILNKMEWSYIHLDYCGWLGDQELREFYELAKCVQAGGRIRTTVILRQPRNQGAMVAQTYSFVDEVERKLHNLIWPYGFKSGTYYTYISDKSQRIKMITVWFDKVDNVSNFDPTRATS